MYITLIEIDMLSVRTRWVPGVVNKYANNAMIVICESPANIGVHAAK